MKILAWDTSNIMGSVAAVETENKAGAELTVDELPILLKAQWSLSMEAAHSERLLWTIDQVLQAVGWTLNSVDMIAVGTGPGSFTGLRIGITTARTLALAQGIPLAGVSSLAAWAYPFEATCSSSGQRVCVLRNAFRGEVFLYQSTGYPEGEERLLPIEEVPSYFANALREDAALSFLVLGDGSAVCNQLVSDLPCGPRLKAPKRAPLTFPEARWVGELGARRAMKGGKSLAALEVHPRYLKPSSAESKLARSSSLS